MKTLFVLCALCSNMAVANVTSEIKPDPLYTHALSSSGPIIQKQSFSQKSGALDKLTEKQNFSTNTYTYLRCWYRSNDDAGQVDAAYVWGIDPSSGDYYRINGYWRSGGILDWQNMFYSDVNQSTLQSVCRQSLAHQNITQPLAIMAAADNQFSFNYTIWTNDQPIQNGINKIVAFGDSLSDDQNVYNASGWLLPNKNSWFLGHFSNGKNWVEYLADNLKLPLYNWAIGGGGAARLHFVIPGLEEQVQSYLQYMQVAQNYRPQNTLFTLLIGGNDLLAQNPEDQKTVDQIINIETRALRTLINSGAKNILLLKMPDLSKSPMFQMRGDAARVSAQVIALNLKLEKLVTSLQAQYGSSLRIQLFDSYSVFNDLLNNPAKYQITNTTQSCLNINTSSALNYLDIQDLRSQCTNPDKFVFWDTLHPTTYIHRLLGDRVSAFLGH